MKEDTFNKREMDKSKFIVSSLYDEPDEKAYWHSRTPYERLQAIELMRQINYGYDSTTKRLQRFFEVVELKQS